MENGLLAATKSSQQTLVSVRGLVKHFPVEGSDDVVRAVDGVSFSIMRGETLGLVGESGCGKSTVGRCLLRLIEPTAGEVLFGDRNVLSLGKSEMRQLRREMQIVFQDPYASLNPRMKVGDIIGEPLVINKIGNKDERRARVRDLLRRVGLNPDYSKRYPHEFSGGQRQRIGVARTLALNPQLIVADEPVSALDVSVQAQVVNLLQELQAEFGLTYLFISHGLAVVEHISTRVAVMSSGTHRGDCKCQRSLCKTAASLHAGTLIGDTDSRPHQSPRTDCVAGRCAHADRSTIRMSLPHALSNCD